jgi:phosphoribosyl-ATP pyrophosphohydrolase
MSDVLQQLAATIAERRRADPEQSYVASLHHKGLNKILEKVGEEATEVILAAKDCSGETGNEELVASQGALVFPVSKKRPLVRRSGLKIT